MSNPDTTLYISQIMSVANPTATADDVVTTMSQDEEIAELRHLNEALKFEKEAAVKRAARRFKDMMHANRRAERAEQAYKKEALERQDDQAKASTLFVDYKQTIKVLETNLMQAQRAGPDVEQFQAMQATNAELEAALAQQKESATQLQARANQTIQELHGRIETDNAQIRNNVEQCFERRLVAAKKQIQDDALRKAREMTSQFQEAHQMCETENETLKQQLREISEMMKWYGNQMQQQIAQRLGFQGLHTSAGVHAGFPSRPQNSSVQPQGTANKRRKLNSEGYVAIGKAVNHQANSDSAAGPPTSDRRQERGKSIRSNLSTATPKRKAQHSIGGQAQPSQPATPIRLPKTPRRHQHSSMHISPLQPEPQPYAQSQTSSPQAQSAFRRLKLFNSFYQQLNSNRLGAGLAPITPQEAEPNFNTYMAKLANQQASTLWPTSLGNLPTLHHTTSAEHTHGQGQNTQLGPQPPLLPEATQFSQQTTACPNPQSPPSNWTVGAPHAHRKLSSQEQRQPLQNHAFQSNLRSPTVSVQSADSLSPVLKASQNADSSMIYSNNEMNVQATSPQPSNASKEGRNLSAQPSMQLGVDMYPSPEDLENPQAIGGSSNYPRLHSWGSLTPKDGSDSFDTGKGQPPFGNIDSLTFGNSFSFNNSSTLNSTSMLSTDPERTCHDYSNGWNGQQAHCSFSQQAIQHHHIDPTLLSHGNTKVLAGQELNTQAPSNSQTTSLDCLSSRTPTVASFSSSQATPSHPSTSRKRPAAPSSARPTPAPSARSTPTPEGPLLTVCIHCHENWWNNTCDVGEPCQNCIEAHKACERPGCHMERDTGTCAIARCLRIHRGDMRYRNVVPKPKTLRRSGKKDERKPSPVELARQHG